MARVDAGFTAIVTGDAPPARGPALTGRELAWAAGLLPRPEVLFHADFESRRLAGFVGDLAPGRGLRGGSALALRPDAGDARWSHAARVPAGRLGAIRALDGTVVEVAVWSSHPGEVAVACRNDTSGKTHRQRFQHPGSGWRTFTFPLLGMTTDYDPARDVVREGDLFVDLAVLVGGVAADGEVLIDDVRVLRKVYGR